MSSLGERIAEKLPEATALKRTGVGLQNAENNRPYFVKSINDLSISHLESERPAIVISGGPSLHRKKSAGKIIASGFKGNITATDGALGYCLRNGLVPDYVVCLDPHPYWIVRWFGDTELESRPPDDYFIRQDLDPAHKEEKRWNQELIELVNHYGPQLKILLCTSVDISVTKRCVEAGMHIYWWNPLYDDPALPDSLSRKLFESTSIPCLVTWGNGGTAAWILTHTVLKRKHIALVGMDFGYAPGTPPLNTQFWHPLVEILGEKRATEAFIEIFNPYLNETWFSDPTYYWYRQVFLELAKEADCITYNCTEGGTLFGDPIIFTPLAEFLSKFSCTKKGENNG